MRVGMSGHIVKFYTTESHLTETVADFLADGVRGGQPLIVIATESHRKAFAESLRSRGLDMEEILSDREVSWLDARAALESFMEGRHPNRELFMATVKRLRARAEEALLPRRSRIRRDG
jgi:KaiC/GvpD/RAD55 family RecA-like ATPase